jgi:hypothetical protein
MTANPLLLLGMSKSHQQDVRFAFTDPVKDCFVVELVKTYAWRLEVIDVC